MLRDNNHIKISSGERLVKTLTWPLALNAVQAACAKTKHIVSGLIPQSGWICCVMNGNHKKGQTCSLAYDGNNSNKQQEGYHNTKWILLLL